MKPRPWLTKPLAWLARARLAADREREWKQKYDEVSKNYQDYVNAENEAVMKRVTELEAFVRNSFCECYDEYGNPKPQPCERCQLLGEDGRVEL